ncbi:MAG: DUF2974 domain-containing protein [Clostridia bacterium]|nr:DUF2974 domain-containing protein [Clostridia bacterium]
MANIIDYIEWRGDLSFIQDPFNEIDNLILSRVSYFPFDKIIDSNEIVTLQELYKRFEKIDKTAVKVLQEEDLDLFPALANSNRFGGIFLKKFINKKDKKQEKQFSAITIILPDGTTYISYRGTDNTLIGWKEDFNMSFMTLVPAQTDAANYLNEIASQTTGNLRIGGHSKGGNLAVYAAAFCNENIRDRIIEVYNNDGPGFFEEIIETENYKRILPKIHTYTPQTSIFGRMLNHEEQYTVVESTETGLYQHSLYSWQVIGKKFVEMQDVTKQSEYIDKTLKTWLKKVDAEQRKKFWLAVYEILSSTNAETISQINENKLANYKKIFDTYKNLDEESKEVLNQTIKFLLNTAKDNIKNDKQKQK